MSRMRDGNRYAVLAELVKKYVLRSFSQPFFCAAKLVYRFDNGAAIPSPPIDGYLVCLLVLTVLVGEQDHIVSEYD